MRIHNGAHALRTTKITELPFVEAEIVIFDTTKIYMTFMLLNNQEHKNKVFKIRIPGTRGWNELYESKVLKVRVETYGEDNRKALWLV